MGNCKVGQTVTFRVGAVGAKPLTYQWAFNGADIAGETDAFLKLERIGLYHSGNYSVIVSNASGIVQDSADLLVTTSDPPSISFMKELKLPEVDGTFRITPKDLERNSDATNHAYFVIEQLLRGTLYIDGTLYSSGDRIVDASSVLSWNPPTGSAVATNPVFIVHVATDQARSSNSVPVFVLQRPNVQLFSWGWNEWGELGNGRYVPETTVAPIMSKSLQWQQKNGFLQMDIPCSAYNVPENTSSQNNWTNLVVMEQQPQAVIGVSNAISMISDMRSAEAVTMDGQLWQWGENWSSDVFGIPRTTTFPNHDESFSWGELFPFNAYFPAIMSPIPRRYTAPRRGAAAEPFTGLKTICGGRLGGGWRIALKDDGTLWSWGGVDDPVYGETGALGRDPEEDGDTVSTIFGRHLLIPKPIEIPCDSTTNAEMRKVVELKGGNCGAIARCVDGTIWWWGSLETDGWEYQKFVGRPTGEEWKPTQLLLGTNPPVCQMSANYNHYVFLKQNGEVYELGYVPSLDPTGLAGLGLDIFTPFIQSASVTEMEEAHTNAPQRVVGLPSNIVQVSAGWAFGAGLTSEGKVWVWGHRTPYKSSLPNEERINPMLIETLKDITNVVAFGNYGIMAIDNRGLLWGWGLNYRGCQLGPMGDIDWDGASNFKAEAVRIPGIENATDLYCTEHNVFVVGTREEGKPVGLKGVGLDQSARITWQPYPGAESYYVFRSASRDEGYELLGITSGLEMVDNGPLVNGTTYYYRVAAKVNGSLTANSWEIAVRPQAPPGAVANFLCTQGCRGAVLSWQAPASIGGGQPIEYRIERATNSSPTVFVMIAAQPTNVLNYLDEGYSAGSSYRVTAWNYSGGTPSPGLQPSGAKVCAPAPFISPAWRTNLWAEREQVTEGYDRVTLRWSRPAIETPLSWRFAPEDFGGDFGTNLINELVTPTLTLSGWLWDRMTSAHGVLMGSNNGLKPAALAGALNQIIESTNELISIVGLDLSSTHIINELLAKTNLTQSERVQLNRRILDVAYTPGYFFINGSVWGNGDGGVSANWLVQPYEIRPDDLDNLQSWLLDFFNAEDQARLATASYSVRLALITSNLNYYISEPAGGIRNSIYGSSRFGTFNILDQSKALLKRPLPATGQELLMLNRLLIQEALPVPISAGPNWGSNLSGFRLHYSLSPTGTEKTIRHYTRDLGIPKLVLLTNEVVWEFSFNMPPYSVCWASVSALINGDEGEASLQVGPLSPEGKPWASGLRAISGYQQVYLDWKDDPRFSSFDVRYTTDPYDPPSLLLTNNLKVNRFWHATTSNTRYRYQVTAYPYDSGETLESEVVAATPSSDSSLGPNSNLIFSAEATPYSGSVLVEWTVPHLAGMDAEALGQTNWQFYLERATSDGHYDILTEMSYGLAFFDDEAVNGQTYTYRVSAIDTNYNRYLAVASLKGGNPGQTNVTPSADLAFTLLPLQPGDGYVKITWPPIRATGFKVQHSAEGAPFSDIGQFFSSSARENATNCCYHLDAQNGIDHSYRVIAITPTGVEIPSDVKTARPLGSLAPLPPRKINASQIKEGDQRSMHLSWPEVRGAASYQLFSRINGALSLVYQGAAAQCRYNLPYAINSLFTNLALRTYPLDFEVRTVNLAKLPSEPYAQRIVWEEDNVQEGAATNLCLRVGAWTSTNGASLTVVGPTNLVLSVESGFISVARVLYYANGNLIGSVEGGSEFMWLRVPGGSNTVWATVEVAGLNPANISAKALFTTTPSVVEVIIRPELSAYQTAVTDLQVPAPALPIVLSRSYSSRITNSGPSDLAIGWNSSWTAPGITLSAPFETGWKPASSEFLWTTYYSIGESQNHVLTVTTPDGQTAHFQVGVKQIPETRHEMFEELYKTVEMEVLPYDPNQGTLSGISFADLRVENSEVWEEASISLTVDRDDLRYSTPTGVSYSYEPDPIDPLRWRLSHIEDLNANNVDYQYSTNYPYRLERIQHSCGRFVFFEHRSQDLLVYTQDPRWGASPDLRYTFIDGYLLQVVRQVGRNDSNIVAVTDYEYGTTNVSASGYSAANARRLVTSYDVRGIRVLSNQYTGDGDLLSQTDANGKVTNYSLDDQNKLQISKTVGTNTTSVTVNHDVSGAISDVTDGSSSLTNSYDLRGRLSTQTDASGNTKIFDYDEQDRMTGETDQLGNTTRTEFNELGLPTLSVDANGNTNLYSYDSSGNTLAHLSPGGTRTIYEYYSPGKIASNSPTLLMRESIIDSSIAYNVMRNYQYTPAGDLEQTTEYCADKSSQQTVDLPITSWFAYYPNGDRLAEIKVRALLSGQQEFICTEFRSDALGRVTNTVTKVSQTPCGTSAVSDWVNNGGIWTVLQSTSATYDLAGRIITSTDAYSNTTASEYDVSGNLIETRYPDGTVSRTAYDGFGRQEWSQDRAYPSNQLTTASASRSVYDSAGRMVRSERWDKVTLKKEANMSAVLRSGAARPNAVVFLEGQGQQAQRRHFTRTVYDSLGRVQYSVSPKGAVTEFKYDAAGRRTNSITYLAYTASTTDPEAAISPGANAQPVVTSFTYDPNGNQATVTDGLGHTTSYFYDEENRLVKTVFPAAAGESPGIRQTFYDGLGRRIREEDESGTATEYVYDFRGLLQAVKLAVDSASPTVTQFRYDTLGNLITQEDAEKRVTHFEYDALGRRVKRILPGGSVQGFGYDSVTWQNQTLARSFVTNFNGQVIVITNDCMGRIMSKALPARPEAGLAAAWVSYAYNARGQLVQVQHTGGVTRTVQQAYDSRGDLRVKSTPEGTLSYSYNNFGELVCISARTNYTGWSGTTSEFENLSVLNTNASSAVWNYQYDGQGRLSQVNSDSQTADASYTYNAVGSLASTTYRNGITTGYDYNPRNWLRRVRSTRGTALVANFDYDEAGTNATAGVGGSADWDNRRLSPIGQRRRVVEDLADATRTVEYDYDALKRLVAETVRSSVTGTPVGAASYQGTTPGTGYDRVGNRRSREVFGMPGLTTYAGHQFDERDRLNPGTEFGYDANGNTTNDNNGGTYLYDAEDRLIRFSRAGTTVEFAYDDSGNRVKKAVTRNGTTTVTRYLVEDRNPTGYAQVMEELPASGTTPSIQYVYGLDLISQKRNGTTRYYGYDGLGSVRYVADDAGLVVDTYTYDAFGILTERKARTFGGTWALFDISQPETPPTGTTPTVNNYRYTGEQWDPDLGMYYLRARYYNPQIGRFWTMDSFEGNSQDPLSLHKYLYAAADPVNNDDPTGLFTQQFGYLAEKAIQDVYARDHIGDNVQYGKWTRLGSRPGPSNPAYRLKPDIFNKTTKRWGEIKPFTPSGIVRAAASYALYAGAFAPFAYWPDAGWKPSTHSTSAGLVPIVFWNAGGMIFYTDAVDLSEDLIPLISIDLARKYMGRNAALLSRTFLPSLARASRLATTARVVDGVRFQQHFGIAAILAAGGVL